MYVHIHGQTLPLWGWGSFSIWFRKSVCILHECIYRAMGGVPTPPSTLDILHSWFLPLLEVLLMHFTTYVTSHFLSLCFQ